MNTADAAKLLGYTGQEIVRVARDSLRGSAIPYRPEAFLQPAHLARMLNQYPVAHLAQPVAFSAIVPQPIPSVSSNCVNTIVSVEHNATGVLPDSLFVKLPMPGLATRVFMNVIQSWALESHFCRHIAPHVPLRTPVTYATHAEGTRFFIIQENLRADPDVALFTNFDMQAGPPLDTVYRCLDAFARLHCAHYGLSPAERERILPQSMHLFLSPKLGTVSRCLNDVALGPCLRQCGELMPDHVADSYRRTMAHWPQMLERWFEGPLSLLHGDSHLGNFFASGDVMGMLDFQAVHWGKGARDIQYFLIDSLPADVLAANEQDFIQYYYERRIVHGSPITLDQIWQDYRGLVFHSLMTIVVSIGFGALSAEQKELMQEILRRCVAAMERVDYAGWLDEQLAGIDGQ